MTSILGLDISSFALHGCLLVPGQPPVLRMQTLGKATDPLIERLRLVPRAMRTICGCRIEGRPTDGKIVNFPACDADWIVIEQPAGKYGLHALLPILGAITASVPSECQVAWRKASEWRADLNAKNTKQAGHDAVLRQMIARREYNEHELDALGLVLAWAKILREQEPT